METASLLVFVRDRCLKQIHLIKEINEQGHFHYLMRSSSFFREVTIWLWVSPSSFLSSFDQKLLEVRKAQRIWLKLYSFSWETPDNGWSLWTSYERILSTFAGRRKGTKARYERLSRESAILLLPALFHSWPRSGKVENLCTELRSWSPFEVRLLADEWIRILETQPLLHSYFRKMTRHYYFRFRNRLKDGSFYFKPLPTTLRSGPATWDNKLCRAQSIPSRAKVHGSRVLSDDAGAKLPFFRKEQTD